MTVRSRKVDQIFESIPPEILRAPGGQVIDVYQNSPVFFSGYEELFSFGHKWPPKKGQFGDAGGDFYVRKRTTVHRPAHVQAFNIYDDGQVAKTYTGPLYVDIDRNRFLDLDQVPPTTSQLQKNFDGVNAWNRFKPTRSQGGLGQALLEAHDVPSLFKIQELKKRALFFKRLGSDYLRVEFGWKPFVRDIKDLVVNCMNIDSKLKQLAKDNGKNVRRRGNVSNTRETSVYNEPVTYRTYPAMAGGLQVEPQTYSRTTTRIIKKDFSASFKYWIPPISTHPDYKEKEQLFRILFGLDLTPSTLWNVVPWSWLADWGSNIGANLSNLNDAQDHLTAMYAYMMCSDVETIAHVVRGKYKQGRGSLTFEATALQITSLKERYAASPFGFGLAVPDFSPFQLSILAALAFQRG